MNVKEIPDSEIYELNGSIKPEERRGIYNLSSIFFMTPQTLLNDLQRNFIDLESIVLVIYGKNFNKTK